MSERIVRRRGQYVLWLFMILFCLLSVEARAEGVRARYLENSATTSVLELTVEEPAPTSIIVQQHIPPGTRIKNATPPYTKFSPGKSDVKWLLKRPRSGVRKIVLRYGVPLGSGRATAVIRCKSPKSGELMTIHVK
ncbi:MAG: hypothetical protein ABFR63_07010 [Thermodesulfobacteriota bacterium]